jgi:phosphatidylglycerophosphate synthase
MTKNDKGSSGKLRYQVTDAESWLTPPNLVTCLRIIGSPGMVLLALMGERFGFGVLAVALVITEWLDGFLARGLHAESALGARLDTVADSLFCLSLLVALVVFEPALIAHEAYWIVAATLSYLCSCLASLIKFRCLPSYHTWAAKGVWIIMAAGVVSLLAEWSAWPLRIGMVCVVLTNLEATAITLWLNECNVNVPSFWHAWRRG